MTATALTEQAWALPLSKRVEFAQLRRASIDAQLADVGIDSALTEAKRRDAELDADPAIGQTHDEVMRLARRALE